MKDERVVMPEEAQAVASKLGVSYLEALAKTSTNVDEVFAMLIKMLLRRGPQAQPRRAGISFELMCECGVVCRCVVRTRLCVRRRTCVGLTLRFPFEFTKFGTESCSSIAQITITNAFSTRGIARSQTDYTSHPQSTTQSLESESHQRRSLRLSLSLSLSRALSLSVSLSFSFCLSLSLELELLAAATGLYSIASGLRGSASCLRPCLPSFSFSCCSCSFSSYIACSRFARRKLSTFDNASAACCFTTIRLSSALVPSLQHTHEHKNQTHTHTHKRKPSSFWQVHESIRYAFAITRFEIGQTKRGKNLFFVVARDRSTCTRVFVCER